jgi:hypothetical protein
MSIAQDVQCVSKLLCLAAGTLFCLRLVQELLQFVRNLTCLVKRLDIRFGLRVV